MVAEGLAGEHVVGLFPQVALVQAMEATMVVVNEVEQGATIVVAVVEGVQDLAPKAHPLSWVEEQVHRAKMLDSATCLQETQGYVVER